MTEQQKTDVKTTGDGLTQVVDGPKPDMANVLKHIKDLEENNTKLNMQLKEQVERNGKLSQKTREGMQSALDTLMKKWMDAVETKDDKVKDQFKCGLEKLVNNSAEDNGVWQMMVSASALHERQAHNLETLQLENNELKQRLDSSYENVDSRVGTKRVAETEISREDVKSDLVDIWSEFSNNMPY